MVITPARVVLRDGILCMGSSAVEHLVDPWVNDQEGGGSTPSPCTPGRVAQLARAPSLMNSEAVRSSRTAPIIPRDPPVQHRAAHPPDGVTTEAPDRCGVEGGRGGGSEGYADPGDGQGSSAQAERFNSSARGKLFIVGRSDLPAGLRAAQMFHAARQFAADFPEQEAAWFRESNTIVLLEVSDGEELETLATRCRDSGVHVAAFSEPDFLDVGLTALAIGPAGSRLVSSIPLAFK